MAYRRHVYQTRIEGGKKEFVYLLDEVIGMEKIGPASANSAEKIAEAATESSYRGTVGQVRTTTSQSLSTQGAWNVMQKGWGKDSPGGRGRSPGSG